MAATDTIIGIVGALTLVAVMVGVFVYEYNNVPDDNGMGPGPEPEMRTVYQNFTGSGSAIAMNDATLGQHPFNLEEQALHLHVVFEATSPGGTADVRMDMTTPNGETITVAPGGQQMLDDPAPGSYSFRIYTGSVALDVSYTVRIVAEY